MGGINENNQELLLPQGVRYNLTAQGYQIKELKHPLFEGVLYELKRGCVEATLAIGYKTPEEIANTAPKSRSKRFRGETRLPNKYWATVYTIMIKDEDQRGRGYGTRFLWSLREAFEHAGFDFGITAPLNSTARTCFENAEIKNIYDLE